MVEDVGEDELLVAVERGVEDVAGVQHIVQGQQHRLVDEQRLAQVGQQALKELQRHFARARWLVC